MTKERPNIYQPSSDNYSKNIRGTDNDDDDAVGFAIDHDCKNDSIKITSSSSSTNEKKYEDDNHQISKFNDNSTANNYKYNKSLDNISGLDSIIEMKEKLPVMLKDRRQQLIKKSLETTRNGGVVRDFGGDPNFKENYYTRKNKIRPEENWRYRSDDTNRGIDNFNVPLGYKKYRNFNGGTSGGVSGGSGNNSSSSNRNNYQQQSNRSQYHNKSTNYVYNENGGDERTPNDNVFVEPKKPTNHGVDFKNWRNDCVYGGVVRNCGMISSSSVSMLATPSAGGSNGRCDGEYNNSGHAIHCGTSSILGIRNLADDTSLGVGLSPPSESLLMQRRLRRASDIDLRSSPATASG